MKDSPGKRKKTRKALSDSELIAVLAARKRSSINVDTTGSDLSTRREDNLKRYMGKKYGDERTGQSQVVTRQCLEAVEWALPSLMRVFASTDKVAEFRPTSSQDVEKAKEESEYLNHVIMSENEGFESIFTFIKAMLMNPTAYMKVYPVDDELSTVETYEHLLPQGLAEMMKDPELEPIESEEVECLVNIPGVDAPVPMPAMNVKFRRTQKFTKPALDPVPPEELSVDSDWNKVSLEGCPYLCHTTSPMRSELIERGYPESIVNSLPAFGAEKAQDTETEDRLNNTLGTTYPSDESTDKSTDRIEVQEHYLWIDTDKDGTAEYRMIATSGQHIFENEEIDEHPFIAGCAVPVPFTHVGLAWQELVEDLQRIYTTLTRQFLNNMYRVNNPRTVTGRGVNLNDVINDLTNSPIRAKDVNQIRLEPTQSVAPNIAPAFKMLDDMKEARTGTSRGSMGLDADALSRVANGAFYASLEQGNQRLELLARVIAEFSIKPMFLKMHRIILTHYTSPREVELSGSWKTINPGDWKPRRNIKMLVGLGTGNKQTQAVALDKIMDVQARLKTAGSPMVTDQNIYASCAKLVSLAEGMSDPETYFTDPEKAKQAMKGQPPKPPAPEQIMAQAQMELVKVEKAKADLRHQEEMSKVMQKAQDDQRKAATKMAEMQGRLQEMGRKLEQGDRKLDIEEFKATTTAEIESAKIMQDDERLDSEIDNAMREMNDAG